MHGASQQAIMAGMSMGFAPHPKTIFNRKKDLAVLSHQITKEKINQALKVKHLSFTTRSLMISGYLVSNLHQNQKSITCGHFWTSFFNYNLYHNTFIEK